MVVHYCIHQTNIHKQDHLLVQLVIVLGMGMVVELVLRLLLWENLKVRFLGHLLNLHHIQN